MATDQAENRSEIHVWNATEEFAVDPLEITSVSTLFAVLMSFVIVTTVVGNVLVILSVFTYRPLRHVQNFYLVSLAVADLAVAVLVMPYNVVYSMLGFWPFGGPFCLAWATCDILTCTASILHLCAVAVDRYRAIHDPIAYAQKRTIRRVLLCVAAVWFVSGLISIPPLLGWNNSSLFNETTRQCQLTDDPGFVVYSASGSFYIPLVVMLVVYVKIYLAVRVRLRARASGASLVTGTTIGMTNVLATTVTGRKEAKARPETVRRRDEEDGEQMEMEKLAGRDLEPAAGRDNGGDASRKSSKSDENGDGVDGETALRRSLANGLSPGRFREIIADSTRRYGSRNRLADDDDALAGGGRGGGSTRVNSGSVHLTQFLAEKQRISLSRERRAARTMSVVMGAFVLCWLPFFLMYVTMSFCDRCQRNTDPRVVNFVVWLGYVNSTLNPLIYTVFNVDFRRAFSALLLQPRCRSSRAAL